MKITTKQIIEIVGIISVVASLVFVGFQLQQDRNIALADVYSIRTQLRSDNLRTFLESESSLRELSRYREALLQNGIFSVPAAWIDYDDPTVTEARRLRGELNVLVWDNWYYQASLGLLDAAQIEAGIEGIFRVDEGMMEYALKLSGLNEYTRARLQEIADRIQN